MRSLPATTVAIKNRIASTSSWLFLFEIFINGGTLVFRLTNNPEPVTFDGKTFQRYGIGFDEIEENSSGDLPTMSITLSNADRAVASLLERYNGFRDEKVVVYLVNSEDLGDPSARIRHQFRVQSATVGEQVASLELGSIRFFDMDWPHQKYLRNSCRFIFGSEECGWGFVAGLPGINPPVGVTPSFFCDKTLNGARGCQYHGDLYDAVAGVDPLHPMRAGFFSTIPKRRGA